MTVYRLLFGKAYRLRNQSVWKLLRNETILKKGHKSLLKIYPSKINQKKRFESVYFQRNLNIL